MSQVTRTKIYLPSYILIVKTISRTYQSISYQVSPSALRERSRAENTKQIS